MAVDYTKLLDGNSLKAIRNYILANKSIIVLEENGSTATGTWLAKTSEISSLIDGQVFLYKIAVAGASTTTLNITANGTALGAKTIYRVGTTKLTTQYGVGQYLLLIYNTTNTCFRVINDYDANSYAYIRQYQAGNNEAGVTNKYPILTRYNLTNKYNSYDTAYARFHTEVYIDISTGYLYAPKIYSGDIEVYTKPSGGIPASDLAESYYLASNPSGFTSNTGTVTSVSAGTGLSIGGTASVTPTVNIASGYKLPTTTEWNSKADASAIPTEATVSGWGFTKNTGTITGISINNTSIGTSGVVNLVTNSTYNASTNKIATMSDIPSTSNFVTISGSQTITGVKTFSSSILFGTDITITRNATILNGGLTINSDSHETHTGTDWDSQFRADRVHIYDNDEDKTWDLLYPDCDDGDEKILATTDQIPEAAPNWWYYESSFTRTLNTGSSVQGSSLKKINSTAAGSEYATTTSGSTISAVNIKVGDLIFTKYGEIGCVTSIPSVGGSAPGYVGYRVKWISGASWYCLEEGALITMFDGSQRPIEEVKQGDSILGWDFENNKPCEAIVLFANFTHRDDKTNFVVFSNGEYISGTEDHFIYSVDKGRDAPISELQEGEKCLNANGEVVEIYGIHRGIYQMGQRNFYHLVSSNNTYFANGVMNAAHPINKFNWMAYGANQDIPQDIMDILIQDAEEFRTYEFLVKNETFRKQSVNLMKEIKTRQNKITELKQFLEDTDYVTIKHSEGLPIDPEILEERQNARDTINQLREEIDNNYQPAYNNLVIEYSPLGADTLLTNEERRAKYFKVANKRDNEALDIFKKYYQKDNE